jgi:uncharacterized protein YndB with AHSA1/START domain
MMLAQERTGKAKPMRDRTVFSIIAAAVPSVLATVILSFPAPTRAELASSGPSGFLIRSTVTVRGTPAAAYARFLDIGSWWNPAHSYSQDGKRLTLKAEPGGCFCESLEDGGFVEHMRVVFVSPAKLLRLQGGLGPLQPMGATGTMTVQFEAAGAETKVTLSYAVTAFLPDNQPKEIATAVDGMLLEQLQRYQKVAAAG